MRKVLALLLSLVMTLTLLVPATWAEEKTAAGYQLPASLKGKTVILHTNDVHGAIDKYAKVAALKNECYDRGASAVVLLDAGDFSQGSTYVSLSKGATAVELMNAVGYDAVTLGNHEFDYGFPQLKANLSNAAADFLVTCVNLVDDEGEPIFAPGATAPVTDADGNTLFNLTVMGVATPETQTKANPALMKGLTFLSGQKLYDAANAKIKVAREEGNADIVIALTHLGVDASSEPNRSIDFVKNVPGVDIVIDGHSHTVMTASKDNGMIQSTGTGLAYVGAFVIDNATKSVESNGLIDLSTYTKEDASVKAIADKIIGEVDAEYGKVFAKTEVELNGDKEPGNRTEETNMGDLITDAMMWAVKTRMPSINMENAVAITNGGGIRAAIKAGDITKKDVFTVLPFGNTLTVVNVTGAELLEALEAATFCTPVSLGGFPQTAGMKLTVDCTKDYDKNDTTYPGSTYYGPKSINRVTIESINGKPFDKDATYAVITNDFLAAGGDIYYAFAAASSQIESGLSLDTVVMDYITDELGGTVTSGIVSALNRSVSIQSSSSVNTMSLIQMDASVSPGNSGGGLFNMNGELIGIVNAKSSSSDAEGLGFAIPINDAIKVAQDLLENGYVTGRPYMGITYLAVNDAQTAAQLGVNAYGIYVVDVVSGGPADKAGLKAGDRIVSIDNTEVAQKTDLGTLMQEHSAGDTLSITVARDGQMQTVSLTLGEKNASNSGNGTNGASRQEKSAESAPQQNPQG